ncbi:MAG TPA: glycoside hydrolase family 130 protein [Flavihumibacter sp.]
MSGLLKPTRFTDTSMNAGLVASLMFGAIFLLGSCQEKADSRQKADGANDWALGPFVKQDSVNPVLSPGTLRFDDPIRGRSVGWEEQFVYNPAAVVKDGKVFLLYRAEDSIGKHNGTSRIGLAVSDDGLHFTRREQPVLYPDKDSLQRYEWEGGCEDPRIAEDEDGTYYMTYTAYDGTTARLFIATSKDLIHWQKHGSVFKHVRNGEFKDKWSKAGSILCRREGERMIATRVNGKYWMYWGESNIYAAQSDDLINWYPVEETDPAMKRYDTLRQYEAFKAVFSPREGMFDSYLVEPGPQALLTEKGILFIYNSRNDPERGDKSLAPGTYAAGQVLIDRNDPLKVIDRTEKYFIAPDKPYEITGNVNNVCFLEGLVYFKNKWFLYYGTADSKIAVAVAE